MVESYEKRIKDLKSIIEKPDMKKQEKDDALTEIKDIFSGFTINTYSITNKLEDFNGFELMPFKSRTYTVDKLILSPPFGISKNKDVPKINIEAGTNNSSGKNDSSPKGEEPNS
ncbi:hypothetical protein [Neobacillus bataviensis]|uniref:hypothetical protein n=1 Tax=Neobacillus bataviensis TaxID=220685 RepID=UPI001CC10AF6|nr:hypothetical protein [Neobacillus bataviensis]